MYTIHILRRRGAAGRDVPIVARQAGGCTAEELPRENALAARAGAARSLGGKTQDWKVLRYAGKWESREAADIICKHMEETMHTLYRSDRFLVTDEGALGIKVTFGHRSADGKRRASKWFTDQAGAQVRELTGSAQHRAGAVLAEAEASDAVDALLLRRCDLSPGEVCPLAETAA
jgi:hypothetical protein